ncbi:MAG TPA: hypothetical protein PLN39_00985 [Candidatus Dojkabacteria bacterium]|nr:hypothetical protein [Candidatus Dojkabacteria bacterium]HOZ44567.1 hypothetical protein [Candidatus Dojkabacteria bacterium]
MNKKGVLGAGFFLIILFVIAGLFLKVMVIDKDSQDNPENKNKTGEFTIEKKGFNFVAKYQFENKEVNMWDYKITGTLPTPCHEVKTEEIVLESYPEQVSVLLTITPPSSDAVCIQVIKEFEKEGTFQASEKAKVSFLIEEE